MMDLYTKVPKWAMAVLIEGRLRPREIQVFAYVLEKTVGFNDDFAPLTPKRIAEATGLGNHVYEALGSLVDLGVLVETEKGIGPSKELPNRYSQIGSKSLPNREKKTPKSGVKTGQKTANSAESAEPKKTTKKTTQVNPLTPITQSEVVGQWLRDVFGVETIDDAKRLSEKGKQSLREILSFSVAAQERAVKVLRSWPVKVTNPSGFMLTILKDPGGYPVPFEAPEKPKRVNPYEAYPWGFIWDPARRGTSSEDDWFMNQAQRVQDFGTGKWRDAWAIYEAEGLVAGMAYVWEHWPKQAREA